LSASSRSHARPADAPRGPRQPRSGRSTLGYIAIILFLFLAGLGIIGSITVVAAYNYLAADLADPQTLTEYQLPEETVIYDRTGQTELARFGEYKRDVVTFEEIPPILLDATTAIEDKTFWENAGFDPLGIAPRHWIRSVATVAVPPPSPSSSCGPACWIRSSFRTPSGRSSASSRRSSSPSA
jgi:membrane peptidoglycan carboxypeptidase